ncbi:iduronate 2-sulfatase-like [Watersipora subatra]|uniref:iduronate 2-sulfatase-like n=1 Tax=Watersipora subatra TaxID=2589382 RepID=UPI00355C49AD
MFFWLVKLKWLFFLLSYFYTLVPILSATNIILLVVDDLRPELGTYGCKLCHTPNIDKLLHRSTQFYNVHSQFALCGPSRTSLLTSRRPNTLTTFDQHGPYWRDLPGNFTSLPQYFKESMYHTTSLGKVFHPSKLSGKLDDFPYSWSDIPYHPSTQTYKNSKVCPGKGKVLHQNIVCPVNVSLQPEGSLPDIQTASETVRRLKDLSSRQGPFFLAAGFHKPHIPLKYPEQYDDLYNLSDIIPAQDGHKPTGLPNIAWNPFMDLKWREDVAALNISFPYGAIPNHFQRRLILSYLAAISYVDDMIGEVLAAVDALHLWNDSIIVLLSDHGWSLGEHGEWSKFSNYDVATRVPFGIYVPPFFGKTVHHVYDMAELVDLFPTLVELAGFQPLDRCHNRTTTTCTEGKSLVSLMYGKSMDPKVNVSFSQYPRPSMQPQVNSDQPVTSDIKYMGYAVKSTQYRYVVWVSFNSSTLTSNLTDIVAEELYDIVVDPAEDQNIINSFPSVGKKLYNILLRADWMNY